jgi:hypothetical protein
MIEQFLGKATSIIVAGAQEQHGLHAGLVKRGAFHGALEVHMRTGIETVYTEVETGFMPRE